MLKHPQKDTSSRTAPDTIARYAAVLNKSVPIISDINNLSTANHIPMPSMTPAIICNTTINRSCGQTQYIGG